MLVNVVGKISLAPPFIVEEASLVSFESWKVFKICFMELLGRPPPPSDDFPSPPTSMENGTRTSLRNWSCNDVCARITFSMSCLYFSVYMKYITPFMLAMANEKPNEKNFPTFPRGQGFPFENFVVARMFCSIFNIV